MQHEVAVADVAGVLDPVQRVRVIAGGADRVVADAVAVVPGVQTEDPLDPALAAAARDGLGQLGDHRVEGVRAWPRTASRICSTSQSSLTIAVVDKSPGQSASVSASACSCAWACGDSTVARTASTAAVTSASASRTTRTETSPTSLARAVVEFVDGGRDRQVEFRTHGLERRPGADPELAVPGVGEELLRCRGRRAGGSRGRASWPPPSSGSGSSNEHGVGLAVRAEAGQVGERGVRAEDVVGVVAADLQPARGDRRAARRESARTAPPGGPRRTTPPVPPTAASRRTVPSLS